MKKLFFLLVLLVLVALPFAIADNEDVNETTSEDDGSLTVIEAGDNSTSVEDGSNVENETSVEDVEEETDVEEEEEVEEENETEVEDEVEEEDNSTVTDTTTTVSNETIEEELEEEELTEEEEEAIEENLTDEAEEVSINLPGGFSRFLAGLGDTFTFSEKKKAEKAMDRVKENKLRILKKMQEKQSGLANAKKWSAEVQKLQLYVEEDMDKAEAAVAGMEENDEGDLEDASSLDDDLEEQEVLDGMVEEEVNDTIAESEDLSSEELEVLNDLDDSLEESTAGVKEKVKEKKVKTAATLVAKGKSLDDVKKVVEKGQGEAKENGAKASGSAVKVKETKEKTEKKGQGKNK